MHRLRDGGARHQVAAELGKDHALAHRVRLMAAAADALQPARHRRRRLDLHDQIDRPHVDAELERRGGDERAQRAGLQQVLDFDALRAGDRSVMRPDERFARQLVERAGQPLRQPPAVDEDQRRAMRANQLEQPRMNRRPDRRPLSPTDAAAGTARRGLQLEGTSWQLAAADRRRRQTGHVLAPETSIVNFSAFFAPASTIVTGR